MFELVGPTIGPEVVDNKSIVSDMASCRESCLIGARQCSHVVLYSEGEYFGENLGIREGGLQFASREGSPFL
jgi:hypothetical protein